jgi:hypothetical protein
MDLDEIHNRVHDLLDLVHEQVDGYHDQRDPDALQVRVVDNLEIALELWLDVFDAPEPDAPEQREPRPPRVN